MARRREADAATNAFYEDFGERVRRARGSMGQETLGTQVGMSRGSISNIEAGRQRVPLHLLPRLAAALGKSSIELLPPADTRHDIDVSGLAADERQFVANVIARAKNKTLDVEG